MRTLLVQGEKTFKITVPDDSKITFGPWSPINKGHSPSMIEVAGQRGGTLRIYDKDKNVVACFSNVTGYRDIALGYAEYVAKEEGATIWKDDDQGYVREHKVAVKKTLDVPTLTNGQRKPAKKPF